jgi:hypothetical protein
MRIQLIIMVFLLSLSAHGYEDKDIKELINKYNKVMFEHQVELVDEVFTQKFLNENGGKEEFIAKVKELPKQKSKKGLRVILHSYLKTNIKGMFFVKVKDESQNKDKMTPSGHGTTFFFFEENGKLKIDGSASDGE